MFELKRLGDDGVAPALEKAKHYRLLNSPHNAESICLDILEVEPDHQEALVLLLLSLTDQFVEGKSGAVRRAHELLDRLVEEYQRTYYGGIIYEREATAKLTQGYPGAGYAAYDGLRRAMTCFAEAEKLAKKGANEAILRWNTCARLLNDNPSVQPPPKEDHHRFQE